MKKLDVLANDLFINMLKSSFQVRVHSTIDILYYVPIHSL